MDGWRDGEGEGTREQEEENKEKSGLTDERRDVFHPSPDCSWLKDETGERKS